MEQVNYENEVWKPVVGYENLYEVSNMGRIKNLGHRCGQHKSNIVLKQRMIRGGYWGLYLYKEHKRNFFLTHRLVYEAFVGPLPKHVRKCKGFADKVYEINHINEDKSNNCVWNLELITKTQNINYGNRTKKQAARLCKPVYQYTMDYKFVKYWGGGAAECARNGFNGCCVGECCRGVQKYHKGFLWSFVPL